MPGPQKSLTHSDHSTSTELAQYFGVSKRTIMRWIETGVIPKPAVPGNPNLWSPAQRNKMLESRLNTLDRRRRKA